jgi:hypothetical protein
MVKFLLFIFLIFPYSALANVLDSSFFNWSVYEFEEEDSGEKQCYMIVRPIKSDSSHASRQKPYLMITRFKSTRTEEVSVFSGYEYKKNSDVYMMVDDREFILFAKEDVAWAADKNSDIKIIKNILKSDIVKVRSDSAFGTYAIDEYSLQGVTRAYARIRDICE